MITDKSWRFKDFAAAGSLNIKEEFNISAITAGLLYERGIDTKEKAEKFLHGTLQDLADPRLMQGMDQAVCRIIKALKNKEKIVIYGDYDVDGVCSITILKECIEMLGGMADYYVPDRFEEGYGINMQAVNSLIAQQYKLLISVDCGITSVEEADSATAQGMDIIITDHHTPGEILPRATAVINPKLDENEDNQYLCGAGVAYKLALALKQELLITADAYQWLDLVALATVADIVPLLGDNHILVKYGLKIIEKTERAGLKALLKEVNLDNRNLSAGQIGFVIAPRLNAAGRLDSARKSVELLLTQDEKAAADIASFMNRINNERRQVEESIYEQALQYIAENNSSENNIIIVAGDGWHQGVIGIVASRLCEKFYRPVIVVSWDGNSGKGSARSIKGFNLYNALNSCKEHLEQFGGHQMAAGLSIARQDFTAFAAALNDYGQFMTTTDLLHKTCWADGEIMLEEIDNNLITELKALEPFGEGNPQPGFILRNIKINSLIPVGSNKEHVKFDFARHDLQGIAFKKPEYMNSPFKECYHDLIGEIDENEFRGKKTFQIKVKEMKMSFIPDNITSFGGLDTGPYLHLQRIITEIRAGRPVIVLYPTVRCLIKYKPALENCINSSLLYCLHGHLDPAVNAAATAHLLRGRTGVYLMSIAYFEDLMVKNRLPDAVKYILPIWPMEALTKDINPACIYERILFGFDEEQVLSSLHKQWTYNKSKRNLIYSNRNTTIDRLTEQIPGIIIEAAVNDPNRRRHFRRQFEQMDIGTFLTDGNYSFGTAFYNIDEVILADLPFSMWETVFMLDQVAARSELKIMLPLNQEQRDQNSDYLSKRYPDEPAIIAVSDYLQSMSGSIIRQETNELVQLLTDKRGARMSKLELLSILQILTDLSLCQIRKKGNIMEIKYLTKASPALDLDKSPGYHEGIAEKKAWADFVQILDNKMNW